MRRDETSKKEIQINVEFEFALGFTLYRRLGPWKSHGKVQGRYVLYLKYMPLWSLWYAHVYGERNNNLAKLLNVTFV